MDQKYSFKVDGPRWHKMKVNGPKNAVSKLMDLDDTPTKVNGPPVHFTIKWFQL